METHKRKKKRGPISPGDIGMAGLFFTAVFHNLKVRDGKPQAARIRHILDLLTELVGWNSQSFYASSQLRDALSRYQWRGRIMHSPSRGFQGLFTADRDQLSEDDVWEHNVVGELLKLVQYPDVLSRIRRCRNEDCREQFFALRRADQEFHLGRCRQHFYD